MTQCRTHLSADFKAKVALAALTETKPLAQLATEFGVAPSQTPVGSRKSLSELLRLRQGEEERSRHDAEVAELHRQIGKLKVENDLFVQSARAELSQEQKQKVITAWHPEVSMERRCQLWDVPRASYYRGPAKRLRIGDLELLLRIDEVYLEHP